MADEIVQSYKINFKMGEGFEKLQRLQKKMGSFNKSQEDSLKRQIALRNKLLTGSSVPGVAPTSPTKPIKRDMGTAFERASAENLRRDLKAARKEENSQKSQALAKEKALLRTEEGRVKALNDVKASILRSSFMLNEQKGTEAQITHQKIRQGVLAAKTSREARDLAALGKKELSILKLNTRERQKQNFLMRRLKSSSEGFAGGMVNAFAIAAGIGGITKVGQEFESIRNTMTTISSDSVEAGKNLEFVRQESLRLGASFQSTAKDYAKLLVSGKGQISKKDTEDLLSGILEASTVLGLSADDTSGSIRAIQQMLGKTKVMSEELRGQLAERLPGSVELMAKAAQKAGLIGKSVPKGQLVSELNKLMESGKLITKEVLPFFTKELREFAAPGLGKAMESNKAQMNRMVNAFTSAADKIFTSGFGEGLSNMFKSIASFLNDNADLWESLGVVIKGVFNGIALAIKVINPILQGFGTVLKGITSIFGQFSSLLFIIPLLWKMRAAFIALSVPLAIAGTSMTAFMAPIIIGLAAITGLIAGLEKFRGFMTKSIQSNFSIINDQPSKSSAKASLAPKTAGTTVNIQQVVDGNTITETLTKSSALENAMHQTLFQIGSI